jgi:hypothetical protein
MSEYYYDYLIGLVETFGEATAAQVQAFAKEKPDDWEAMIRYLRSAIEVFDQNTVPDSIAAIDPSGED